MMAKSPDSRLIILVSCLLFLVFAFPVDAFGAGNIPSISSIEGYVIPLTIICSGRLIVQTKFELIFLTG